MPSSIPESGSGSRPGALRRLTRHRGALLGLVILALSKPIYQAKAW